MSEKYIPKCGAMTLMMAIILEDIEIDQEIIENIKKIYLCDYGKYKLSNIDNTDEKAYEYYISLLHLCALISGNIREVICFKNLVSAFIDVELERLTELEDDTEDDLIENVNYRFGIMKKFEDLKKSNISQIALMTGDAGYLLEEMVKNSFDEAERLIEYYIKKLKSPFKDVKIYFDKKDLKDKKESFGDIFENNKKFTHLVRKNHGLSPLINKGDNIYFAKEGKIIHLRLLRGLVIGHIKKYFINSIKIIPMMTELNTIIESLSKVYDDGTQDTKIGELKNMLLFIGWAKDYTGVIEYFDLAQSMKLNGDEIRKFAVKISNVGGDSFPQNIDKLMNSKISNFEMDKLIDIDDEYDRLVFLGIDAHAGPIRTPSRLVLGHPAVFVSDS